MKKIIFLTFIYLTLTSCRDDFYEGDQRIIIEGSFSYNNTPLPNALVNIYPVYDKPKNGIITELNYDDYSYKYGNSIIKTYTNNLGHINVSIPRNIDTEVYVLKITKGSKTKYYGYISNYNTSKYYLNFGTLTF